MGKTCGIGQHNFDVLGFRRRWDIRCSLESETKGPDLGTTGGTSPLGPLRHKNGYRLLASFKICMAREALRSIILLIIYQKAFTSFPFGTFSKKKMPLIQ